MTYQLKFQNENSEPLKKLIWLTDLHLDAIDRVQYRHFFDLINAHEVDFILIGGDISNGETSLQHLVNLQALIKKQFYFVLGNHDFYYGSVANIRNLSHHLTQKNPLIHYLTTHGMTPLTDSTILIGHDGWSDGSAGDFLNSDVVLNDYLLIDELKRLNHEERYVKLKEFGTEAATFLKGQLELAFKTFEKVILLTHVPPFEESCLHNEKPFDSNWAPHFVGKITGEAIKEVMLNHPDKKLLILCGHTHRGQDIHILPNLRVVTGKSEVGKPSVQGIITID